MQYPEYACSSITVSRELPARSGFLAHGDGRPGMQVGPETDQCVDREVETRDAHIPSSMWRVHYHSRRCQSAVGIAVDGHPVTGSAQSSNWEAMGWLRDTFPDPEEYSTEIERIR
ncbi:hypothetical protein Gotur_023848 [Gossypium turneri]